MERPRIPLWILLLILILTIWNPASLALQAASGMGTIGIRSTFVVVALVLRLIITSVGVAAGRALWMRRPGAVWLAKLSLALFAIEAVVRFSSRVDVGSAPPGTRLPIAMFIILHNGVWYLYLQNSGRVRAFYGLESHV